MPTVLVTGANRGLGLEFVRQYRAAGWEVIAAVRSPSPELDALGAEVRTLDLAHLEAVADFGVGRPLDLLLANAGMMEVLDASSAADGEQWLGVARVNAVAPYLLAKAVLPQVRAAGGKLVAVSTLMASIADNSSGGYLGYRSSKTMLNMAWQTLALANPDLAVALIHPGWVRTRMGGEQAPIEAPDSVAGMIRVIDGLSLTGRARFLDHSGKELPW